MQLQSGQSRKLLTDSSNDKPNDGDIDAVSQLLELLRCVDVGSPEANLNATSISDGKGGRILL